MKPRLVLPVVAGVLVLVAAAVSETVFLPSQRADTARMAKLAPPAMPAGFNSKPANSAAVPTSSSPYPEVKTAAKRSPASTGSYSVEWTRAGSASSSDGVAVLITALPTQSEAATVEAQATKTYLQAQSFTASSLKLQSRFSVSGVPGAGAALFVPTAATNKQDLAAVVDRVDRVVVLEIVRETPPASKTPAVSVPAAQASAVSLAQTEHTHLAAFAPGFSLTQTRWPVLETALLSALAVVIAAALMTAPLVARRTRQRRRMAREAAARRQVMSRGGKIARRQAGRRSGPGTGRKGRRRRSPTFSRSLARWRR